MKTKTIIGYKFVKSNMKSDKGNLKWELGKWVHEEDIKLCEKGLHACRTPLQSLEYISGRRWFIVEAKGKIIEKEGDKFVASDMRLIQEIPLEKVVKRFAIFCAKQCLKNYERKYPKDRRVADAIQAAEDYLDGKIMLADLDAASSASLAARSAASSASSASLASLAAWSAASSAASSAAWSAASSAAWSAASSASSASSAAWSAASSAARSAESEQNKELLKLIKQELKTCKR